MNENRCRCVTGRDYGTAPGPNHDARCPAYLPRDRDLPTSIGAGSWEALFQLRKGLDREMAEQMRQALAVISMRFEAIEMMLTPTVDIDSRLLREDIDECRKALERIGEQVRKLDAWSKT